MNSEKCLANSHKSILTSKVNFSNKFKLHRSCNVSNLYYIKISNEKAKEKPNARLSTILKEMNLFKRLITVSQDRRTSKTLRKASLEFSRKNWKVQKDLAQRGEKCKCFQTKMSVAEKEQAAGLKEQKEKLCSKINNIEMYRRKGIF